MKFTYDAYRAFLARRQADGYDFRGFHDDPPLRDDPVMLLRHDVDLDLDRAVDLAKVEHAANVQATYFILVTSPFFNVNAVYHRARVRALADLGHWIGLHYDWTDPEAGEVDELADYLDSVAGVEVRAVSFHKPASNLVGADAGLTAPLPHAYQPEFVNEIEYCSDSTGAWRYGPPDARPPGAMQLLTHPEWWADKQFLTSRHRMRDLLAARAVVEHDRLFDVVFDAKD